VVEKVLFDLHNSLHNWLCMPLFFKYGLMMHRSAISQLVRCSVRDVSANGVTYESFVDNCSVKTARLLSGLMQTVSGFEVDLVEDTPKNRSVLEETGTMFMWVLPSSGMDIVSCIARISAACQAINSIQYHLRTAEKAPLVLTSNNLEVAVDKTVSAQLQTSLFHIKLRSCSGLRESDVQEEVLLPFSLQHVRRPELMTISVQTEPLSGSGGLPDAHTATKPEEPLATGYAKAAEMLLDKLSDLPVFQRSLADEVRRMLDRVCLDPSILEQIAAHLRTKFMTKSGVQVRHIEDDDVVEWGD
jgi:hypothetical protein